VQSGKQKKKFSAVLPDASFAAIVEVEKFLYVYKKKAENEHKSVHQIVQLPVESVLGIQLLQSSKKILLLTKSHLWMATILK
jgi:hypothetical protein